MCPEMTDKSVATESDFQGEGHWKMVQLESLLAALVDSKVVAMKAESGPGYLRYQQRDHHHQRNRHHHHHHHHGRHHHHHHHHHRTPTKEKRHNRSRHHEERAKCKVRQWDDGTATLVHDPNLGEDRYVTVDMEDSESEHITRKKRRKRRRNVGPIIQHPVTQIKVVDPEDLPKRARWTIIITAGFLLITCMLLVGIMLRMAPVIDQMVNQQNEELISSLHRAETDYNETFISR